MELTKKERLSFVYQLLILEKLYPEEADHYARHRKALEEGYALHYDWMVENLYEELSEADCREVLDVLDMYRAIDTSFRSLDAADKLRNHYLAKFKGYDGNNETAQMGYARYFIVDLDRFSELKDADYPYFNSHAPMIATYRAMLARWREVPEKFSMSRSELASVLGADE